MPDMILQLNWCPACGSKEAPQDFHRYYWCHHCGATTKTALLTSLCFLSHSILTPLDGTGVGLRMGPIKP